MTEVLRTRIVRAPKRTMPKSIDLVKSHLTETEFLVSLESSEDPRGLAQRWIEEGNLVDEAALMESPIVELDYRLSAAENRLEPREFATAWAGENLLEPGEFAAARDGDNRRGQVGTSAYMDTRVRLGDSLLACLMTSQHPDDAMRLNRLLLVCGLVELLAEDEKAIADAEGVYRAMRWRSVVMPRIFTLPVDKLSRRPGFADLYLVRQDWVAYEAGEVAYIENVMRGESKKRSHSRTDETEVTIFTETEEATRDERDTQTTDRFELSTEASRQTELALHLEASVDAQGPAGPVTIQGHVGGSVDFSQSTADSRASTISHEAVSRAVKIVETRTRETRTARSLTRIIELNKHVFDNTENTDHAVGIYRWVNKVQRLQVFRYPHRFLIEFQLPDPGAWWRQFLVLGDDARGAKRPPEFTTTGDETGTPLGVADITEQKYSALAARYRTIGLSIPPPPILTTGATLEFEDPSPEGGKQPIRFHTEKTLAIPEGYRAVAWSAKVLGWHNGAFGNNGATFWVAVGDTAAADATAQYGSLNSTLTSNLGNLTGTLPVSVMTDATFGYGINIVVTCHRLDATLLKWQQATYDSLAEAYQDRVSAYESGLDDDSAAVSAIRDGNPQRNRQVVRDQLKQQIAGLLLPASVGVDALEVDSENFPRPNESAMLTLAPSVSFFEQAFEWENLSYVLYPSYWASREAWPMLAEVDMADPEFASFLRAGSARVIAPARPGFESAVNFFLHTGMVWGGVQTPVPGDPWYLSLDAEIRAQQMAPLDGVEIGDPWEIRLPTDLVWLQENAELPTNPSVELA